MSGLAPMRPLVASICMALSMGIGPMVRSLLLVGPQADERLRSADRPCAISARSCMRSK